MSEENMVNENNTPQNNDASKNTEQNNQQTKENPKKENAQQPQNEQPQTSADNIDNSFKTPPAGVYPKTDSQGRVIRYKKRGGIFPFFVGIFFSLFLFIFCGGLVLSYFYYCYKIEDVGKTLGVNLSFLPEETTNKTASDIVKLLMEYKDGYTEMTVKEAKDKLGLDIEEVVSKNLGIEINDFYGINLTIKNVNNNNPINVGDLKIQDVLNNSQSFVDALLPELYKRIALASILDFAQIDLSKVNKPLTTEAIFDVNPDATFEFNGTIYTIDFTEKRVYDSGKTISVQIVDNIFSINETEFEISNDKTKLSYNETTINLTYNHSYKKLDELTIDELLNSIIPDYVGGEYLTLRFVQNALNLNLIDETNPEYASLLDSKLTDIKIDEALDSVSIRSLQTLLGINLIPTDDERYDAILDEKAGQITVDAVTTNLSMGALIDLIKINLPDLPFLNYDEFKNTSVKNISSYMESLKVSDFINNVISEVHPYTYFTVDETNYYIDTENNTVFIKDFINKSVNSEIQSLNDHAISSYTIYGKKYIQYENNIYKNSSSNINGNSVTINGETYTYDGSTLTKDGQTIEITNDIFTINDENDNIIIIGKMINNNQISYYTLQENSKVVGKLFRIKFIFGVDAGFSEDTTIEFRIKQDDSLEYLKQVATIENNTFILSGSTYTLTQTNVTSGANTYDLNEKSTTTQIALYAVQDLTLKNIIDGDLSSLTTNDAKLNNLTINDVLSTNFNGILQYLNGLTLGEIVEQPTIMLDRIKLATFAEILDITNESNALLRSIKDLTIGEVMDNPSSLMNKMGTVTFEDLGLTDTTNPIINILKDITIQQVLDNELEGIIKDITLSELTNSTTGIMSILGDLTIGDFNGSDAITNRLQNSEATLSELLEKELHFFDYFEITDGADTLTYHIIENLSIGGITAPDGIYEQSEKYDITNQTFEMNSIIYHLNIEPVPGSGYYIGETSSSALTDPVTSNDVKIEDNKFIFNNKVYVISGKYVYEYSKDSNITNYSISGDEITITTADPASTDTYDIIKVNSLNNAMLSIKLSELFGNNFENTLKAKVQSIKLADVLTDTSNTLISAIINKNPDVTINSIGDVITSLTMADVFGESQTFYVDGSNIYENYENSVYSNQVGTIDTTNHEFTIDNTTFYLDNTNTIIYDDQTRINQIATIDNGQFTLPNMNFNKGILKLLNIKDTTLLNVVSVVNSFDFGSQKVEDLIDEGILDFGAKNSLIKTKFPDYTVNAFANYMIDINNKNVAELIDKGLLDFGSTINNTIVNDNTYNTLTLGQFIAYLWQNQQT